MAIYTIYATTDAITLAKSKGILIVTPIKELRQGIAVVYLISSL